MGKSSLAGKKAIVTGGAGGIGRSTAAAMAELGGLDCVHSNAGIVANDDTVDMPFESWNRMVSVNFTGMFLVDQAAAGLAADARCPYLRRVQRPDHRLHC